MIVFAFSADFLWMFRETFAQSISNLHHKVAGKNWEKKTLLEILGSFVILDSEKQISRLLVERFSSNFHY